MTKAVHLFTEPRAQANLQSGKAFVGRTCVFGSVLGLFFMRTILEASLGMCVLRALARNLSK